MSKSVQITRDEQTIVFKRGLNGIELIVHLDDQTSFKCELSTQEAKQINLITLPSTGVN